jgi:hypothetical protein
VDAVDVLVDGLAVRAAGGDADQVAVLDVVEEVLDESRARQAADAAAPG